MVVRTRKVKFVERKKRTHGRRFTNNNKLNGNLIHFWLTRPSSRVSRFQVEPSPSSLKFIKFVEFECFIHAESFP